MTDGRPPWRRVLEPQVNSVESAEQVESQSRALRHFQRDRALVDVVCRRRLIARVLDDDGSYRLAADMVGSREGRAALVSGDMPSSGYAINTWVLAGADASVPCRCRRRRHILDGGRLNAEAIQARPGRPREVAVASVQKDPPVS